jgi:arylsulfatase
MRRLPVLTAALALGSGFVNPPRLAADSRLPNVVLVYADDLGYGDVGAYGAKRIRTRHIDRLAAEGVRFTDFYVTQAVCSASRAGLLTGAYPNRIGIWARSFPPRRTASPTARRRSASC